MSGPANNPASIDEIFAAWLRTHERAAPTDHDLTRFVAAFPFPGQRRAARLYARGFVRGCDFCEALGNRQRAQDLARLDAILSVAVALVRDLRAAATPPESTT